MFTSNQSVQRISSPSTIGVTTGKTRVAGTSVYIEIQTNLNERLFVSESDLRLFQSSSNGIDDLLKNLKFGSFGDLARILTFQKISSKLSNVFYAMEASRTDFHPHQFKPVYKFIESPNNRILIADEVGLGKTIEAGLIWLESIAREDAKRLLIVCPSMLKDKWKKELRTRFNVKAETYDSKGILSLLQDFRNDGENFQCVAVCSLASIRQQKVQEALLESSTLKSKFDLIVFDEAHHLRNTETESHKTAKILSDFTDAMILLTATPIHLGNRDLFNLLKLLDTEEFSEFWQFESIIQQNEPIVKAQNLLRMFPPRITEALEEINKLDDFYYFNGNYNLQKVTEKLKRLNTENRREMIEVGLLLEKLNLLSSRISRTRKREVTEWRVLREAQSLTVTFTKQEMDFYNSVTERIQEKIEKSGDNRLLAFSLMMPQRQMASCIPAMIEHYRETQFEDHFIDEESLSEVGFTDEIENPIKNNLWLGFEQLITETSNNMADSKFEVLITALRERFEREPDVKIIIFSYFKKTLSYLNRQLSQFGYKTTMIHGDIPMKERQELIEDFRDNPLRKILLSSEVGSEGIDLQFCRIVFNYDLPWNPMKVEQRIGRLDRIGQKAEKISIINFAVENTIEEKILNRLYTRLGIFERSLGDLEAILGDLTQQLSIDLLRRRLSDEQQIQRIEQTLLAAEKRRQDEVQLTQESSVLLGTSDYILEQISNAKNLGRRITPNDLRRFIEDFFNKSDYQGTSINWNDEENTVNIKLSNKARNEFFTYCQNQNPILQTQLKNNDCVLLLTGEKDQENLKLELLTHFHPLVHWIKSNYDNEFLFPTSAVELKTDIFPSGDYLIVIQNWEFHGIKKSRRIEYDVAKLNNEKVQTETEIEELLQEIIKFGKTWEFASRVVDSESIIEAWENCKNSLLEKYTKELNIFKLDNQTLREKRRNHLESFSIRKQERLQSSLETMRLRDSTENKMKGFKKMLENERKRFEEESKKFESQTVTEEFNDIAVVLCRIKN